MFSSPAYAQAAFGGGNYDMFVQIAPFVLIFVVFYFLLIRPQQTRAKQLKNQLANLRKGDTVVTGGGIMGKVVKTEENIVFVEIADNVRVRVVRQTITDVVGKTEPVKADAADGKAAAGEAKKD